MTTNEIRKKFLEFFRSKGHSIITSDSLVPKDDPTVLFTTAGMQQFKPQFLGRIDGYTRAASCQKCLRTDDLDVVGKTDCHHTFFEMLGNFSFGDYFKKDAIAWAWEFFTEVLKIPKEKLWVSVYKDDAEAESIWLNHIQLPKDRLVTLGDKSNFWPSNAKEAGPNGPCGPCSEIFYDYGVNPNCKNPHCDPDCNCGRFTEVWNLVFTQFNRKEGGILEPLPAKNIDTGMGLERLAAVLQRKKSNYDTDLFEPILRHINALLPNISVVESRIIADHMRAVTIGIGDGVIPSNEGRGYVMKKLIINVSDLAVSSGILNPVAYQLVQTVVEVMSSPYPELVAREFEINQVVRSVEESYLKVRKERLPEFERKVKESGLLDAEKLGQIIFAYRDTYGLTLSTIDKVLQGLNIDAAILKSANTKFNELMEEQQTKSRASSKMTGDVFAGADIKLDLPKTKFLGYEHDSCEGTVLKIFKDDGEINEAKEGDVVKIVLDQTVFYAESGGQIGDTGTLWAPKVRIRVNDTQKINEIFIHYCVIEEGLIKVGDKLGAQIDDARRLAIMRNHTATHLLQAVLREILGPHVKQQGSLVADDRLRFDFTHPQAISSDQVKMIEDKVNRYILGCHEVKKEALPIAKAKESGALAFFAEKYGDTVRVVTIGPFSKEFCGGTHLKLTGQVGPFKIVSEGAVAQGIRRIEAFTGTSAFEYLFMQENELKRISAIVKSPVLEVSSHIEQLTRRLKELEKDSEKMRLALIGQDVQQMVNQAHSVNGVQVIAYVFKDMSMDVLRKVSDLVKQKAPSAVVVLGSHQQHDAFLLMTVSEDLVKKGMSAGELIKDVAPLMGGSGGGRPQMAQAGSKSPEKINSAVNQAVEIIKRKISS
ncbi:MAG: alanine--tRNA ligase [Candidatus Omnitrophica bacterium]|nr:alanine--tRNA ligase [Candidatus Omnitrophota bacterium]